MTVKYYQPQIQRHHEMIWQGNAFSNRKAAEAQLEDVLNHFRKFDPATLYPRVLARELKVLDSYIINGE